MGMIEGKLLMIDVMVGGREKTIAMAKSCSLNLNASTSSVLTKDDNEDFDSKEVTGMSWTMDTENLIPVVPSSGSGSGAPLSYHGLFDLMKKKEPVMARFVFYDGAKGKETGDKHDWGGTAPLQVLLTGKVLITSLEVNGKVKDKATLTASFTGFGQPSAKVNGGIPGGPSGE